MFNKILVISLTLILLIFTITIDGQSSKQCKARNMMAGLPIETPKNCKKLAEKGMEFAMKKVNTWFQHYFDGCVANKVSLHYSLHK